MALGVQAFAVLLFIISIGSVRQAVSEETPELLLIAVASNATDGFRRLERSARINNVPLKVLGMNQKWAGGDMSLPGGGYKINLLKKELAKYKDDSKRIIMFTDAYDVIIIGNVDRIMKQFLNMDARIVFSAEGFCWPDESLASKYPTVARGKRYLNSGGFIGYAPELYQLVTIKDVEDTDDDQLYYTQVYLDPELRSQLGMKLDHRSLIFQNLHGVVADVELRLEADNSYIKNTAYATTPLVLHGNGPSKTILNSLGNYVSKSWTLQGGCYSCDENQISLSLKQQNELPVVLISIFIHQPTPFLEEFFEKIAVLDYPKSRVMVFIHNAVEYHSETVESFLKDHGSDYRAFKTIDAKDKIGKDSARELAIDYCILKNCDAYLNVDSEAHLDNPKSLRILLELNRGIVGPVLTRPFKAWSNFWGALSGDGFYARSADYMDIVNGERRGLWNVPYLNGAYLINATLLTGEGFRNFYRHNTLDPDMAFCFHLRKKGIFMFVSNTHDFGHLVNPEAFDIARKHPDMYMLLDNRWDWEQRYLHPDYALSLDPNATIQQPCPDVYWFPVTTPRFCKELIEIMENFGKWSDGSNKDERLSGGYENVPTRDIHMNQVGLEPLWLEFLKAYIRPLVERVYIGYSDAAPRALMNFVVRYRPDEQPFLRPHHDSSTYTINLALNRAGIDYEGGGCNFLRYNCSVKNTRLGWLLMHPGRLTHFHEGLPVTNGTRYIMISFVDP